MGPIPGRPGLHVLAGFSIFGSSSAEEPAIRGGVDRRGPAERQHVGARRPPLRRVRELHPVRRRPRLGGVRGRVQDPLPGGGAPSRQTAEDGSALRRPAREARCDGRPLGLGAALWFSRNGPARDEYSFRRGNWFDAVGDECRAVRTGVGVLDQTSFAKFIVSGEGATALLDRLCANRLPAEEGRVSLAQMLTPKGGIEADVTVTLLERGRYYVVSAAATETHDLAWIHGHAPADGSVEIVNVTDRNGVLTIAGPRLARKLLAAVDATMISRTTRFPSSAPATLRSMCTTSSPCASRTSASWAGSSTTQSSCSAPSTTCSTTPEMSSASSTSATARSSRCASRSATGSGGRTCRRTGHPCRPGSSASWPSTRTTSSARTRSCASASRASRTVSVA